ncbi:MAG: hypothetical protein R3C56_02995 [Pirellulaceae bacterium]
MAGHVEIQQGTQSVGAELLHGSVEWIVGLCELYVIAYDMPCCLCSRMAD